MTPEITQPVPLILSFKDFLREQGINPKKWNKVVEKWASPDGIIYQRNYWTDGINYYYHGDGIE